MHVHVASGEGEAKVWLEPKIEVADNYRYSKKQLKQIQLLVEVHCDEFINSWKRHFGG